MPARVAGAWDWDLTVRGKRVPYSSVLEHRFQSVEGVVRAGSRREVLQHSALRGDHIQFTLAITDDGPRILTAA